MLAVFANNLFAVRALLRDKAIVDAQLVFPISGSPEFGLPGGAQPLHSAMAFAGPKIVAALLKAGADPYAVFGIGINPFHFSCAFGRLENMKEWRKIHPSWDLELTHRFGGTSLSVAAFVGQNKLAVISWLLENGANLWCRSHLGGTVLTAAVVNVDTDPAVVRMLLGELSKRSCALHPYLLEINWGCQAQTVKMRLVEVLFTTLYRYRLSHKALVVGLARGVGCTALHLSAERGDREVFELLLQAGSDPTKRTGLGLTATDWAVEHGFQNFKQS